MMRLPARWEILRVLILCCWILPISPSPGLLRAGVAKTKPVQHVGKIKDIKSPCATRCLPTRASRQQNAAPEKPTTRRPRGSRRGQALADQQTVETSKGTNATSGTCMSVAGSHRTEKEGAEAGPVAEVDGILPNDPGTVRGDGLTRHGLFTKGFLMLLRFRMNHGHCNVQDAYQDPRSGQPCPSVLDLPCV